MSGDSPVRYAGPLVAGPARSSPYPVSRLAPPHDLVDVARQIQEADAILSVKMSAELAVIADQIRLLQDRAREALEAARASAELHRATCHFKKRVGAVYHLYRKATGEAYFSMLSPGEWGERTPHPYEASYRLEPDMSFVRVDDAG